MSGVVKLTHFCSWRTITQLKNSLICLEGTDVEDMDKRLGGLTLREHQGSLLSEALKVGTVVD